MTNLFLVYDLMGFVDGTRPCPPANNLMHKIWICQDRLLLIAIQIVVTRLTWPIVSRCKNDEEAWCKLKTTYANKSNTLMVGFIDSFAMVSQEEKKHL